MGSWVRDAPPNRGTHLHRRLSRLSGIGLNDTNHITIPIQGLKRWDKVLSVDGYSCTDRKLQDVMKTVGSAHQHTFRVLRPHSSYTPASLTPRAATAAQPAAPSAAPAAAALVAVAPAAAAPAAVALVAAAPAPVALAAAAPAPASPAPSPAARAPHTPGLAPAQAAPLPQQSPRSPGVVKSGGVALPPPPGLNPALANRIRLRVDDNEAPVLQTANVRPQEPLGPLEPFDTLGAKMPLPPIPAC